MGEEWARKLLEKLHGGSDVTFKLAEIDRLDKDFIIEWHDRHCLGKANRDRYFQA